MTRKQIIHTGRHRRSRRAHRGGSPLPLSYFQSGSVPPTVTRTDTDRMLPHGQTVRPALHVSGGRRRLRPFKGGFVPSVMEGFAAATSKYVTPIALMLMYRLIHRDGSSSSKKKRTMTRKGKARRRE